MTSTRTLWRSAFCTTRLFSLLARAGSENKSESDCGGAKGQGASLSGLPCDPEHYKASGRFQNPATMVAPGCDISSGTLQKCAAPAAPFR